MSEAPLYSVPSPLFPRRRSICIYICEYIYSYIMNIYNHSNPLKSHGWGETTATKLKIHPRKVDVRLPGNRNSNSHGARPVYLITMMMKWNQTSRLTIKKSLASRLTMKNSLAKSASLRHSPAGYAFVSTRVAPILLNLHRSINELLSGNENYHTI